MKAERMMKILILLQYGKTISTPTLAKELEVSERTIHRDMESLHAAGIPVFSERGKSGGWRLVDDWKQKLSWLKDHEVLTLFLPHAEKLLSDLNMDASIADLGDKLALSLPEPSRERALNLWERVYIDMGTWRDKKIDLTSVMGVLQEAVMNNKQVSIHYEKANGTSKEISIKPLGLVAKGSTWYIAAQNENDDFRNYKVERIVKAVLLDEHFDRPSDFKLADYWEGSKQDFVQNLPEFNVKVNASPSARERIMFTGRFVQTSEFDKLKQKGWTEMELIFPTEEEAVNFLLGFGDQLKVKSPTYLIDEITERARKVIRFYQ
ncbi:helix-turn-helix transcriptional regulator [Halobacillus naozhouensis]|uniref:YafY family protein n=1 Tax=Halobacillus naozhouensis TaxID=554880 RepID=A0ABY8J4K1_9BACI|nr:YafY family protein [Halobacillus naozhouensis]WFT76358.1 YafY family protein [Halobacillus naozhouensis]